MPRDRAPIDQAWIQQYCDEFIKVGLTLPDGALKDAVTRRIDIIHDLVDAWQQRNVPIDQRERRR